MMVLQQLVDEVVGAAEEDPEAASDIYAGAAQQFRDFARQPGHRNISAALAARANEFESLARMRDQIRFAHRGTQDDFSEIEKDHAQAHAEVGQFDDLEIKARRNQIKKLRSGRLNISIAPESVMEDTWRLGNQVAVKFNPTDDDKINKITAADTVVLWQGVRQEAQSFTIDVGVTSFPPLGTTVSCRPYGIVTYGADGFQMSFTFDVGLGTRFTGVGNYCSVLVGQGAPRTGFASGLMTIGASLGFFAAPSQAPLFFTQNTVAVLTTAPGFDTEIILRPPRATFLLPIQGTDNTGVVTLDFLDYAGVSRYSLQFAVGTQIAPIPLTTEIAAIQITNIGPLPSSYSLPFMLAT